MRGNCNRIVLLFFTLFACWGLSACGTENQESVESTLSVENGHALISSNEDYLSEKENYGNDAEIEVTDVSDSNTLSTNNLLDFEPLDLMSVPKYTDEAVCILNDNIPNFTEADETVQTFEYYSELDSLGRCGVATANLSKELMPTEERGAIGHIRPSGWHTVKYPDTIEDLYLFNRCHLIAYMLAGENDNEKNLITGTRYLNAEGMLPYEIAVADYISETNNHVLYRIEPCFYEDELVARGVHMEAYSIEDDGHGISFNIFVYNMQPGIVIDYATGESKLEE